MFKNIGSQHSIECCFEIFDHNILMNIVIKIGLKEYLYLYRYEYLFKDVCQYQSLNEHTDTLYHYKYWINQSRFISSKSILTINSLNEYIYLHFIYVESGCAKSINQSA